MSDKEEGEKKSQEKTKQESAFETPEKEGVGDENTSFSGKPEEHVKNYLQDSEEKAM
jgi:hypothetical protein